MEPTLVQFLLVRLMERTAAALAAVGDDPPPWTVEHEVSRSGIGSLIYGARGSIAIGTDSYGGFNDGTAPHIALNDPAYVLADCEAKRRLVGYLAAYPTSRREAAVSDLGLRLLAVPFADHPDFREEWKT